MKRVRVYFNIHKKCLSIQHKNSKGWRVWRHVSSIGLSDVVFKVSEAGRQRVIREKRKNVHAYIEGTMKAGLSEMSGDIVTYNPYRLPTFVIKDSDTPIHTASEVYVVGRRITASPH